jgi:hypothetical protein
MIRMAFARSVLADDIPTLPAGAVLTWGMLYRPFLRLVNARIREAARCFGLRT